MRGKLQRVYDRLSEYLELQGVELAVHTHAYGGADLYLIDTETREKLYFQDAERGTSDVPLDEVESRSEECSG